MQTNLTWTWLDGWLSGLLPAPGRSVDDARRERFAVARTATALAALVALPLLLIGARAPLAIECAVVLTALAPLAAVFVLSRTGRIALAQGLVSAALTACILGAALTAPVPLAAVAGAGLLVVADAAAFPSRRMTAFAAVLAVSAWIVAAWMEQGAGTPGIAGTGDAVLPWGEALLIAVSFAFGHVASLLFADRRMQRLLRDLKLSAESCEAGTLYAIDDLVTWHDSQGAVLRATPAASVLLGVQPAALTGSGLFTRVHVGDRPTYLKTLSDAVHSRRAVSAQIRLKTGESGFPPEPRAAARDGRPDFLWVDMRAHAFRAASDERCAVVCVLRDVTALRSEMSALNDARREAVQANADRTQLLATVSHELRTPLNAILGYSELMAAKGVALPPDQRLGYAQTIHQSGQHMLEVVSTLLDLATIESGHYEMAFERVDMGALARECCAVMALPAQRGGVRLREDIASDLPALHADRRGCRQILLNLLSNAIKFTPEGGQVIVRLRPKGEAVLLTVQDNGVGVPRTELHRLGLPFYRGSAKGGGAKGSGLGLSVVRGLVDLHGGRLRIDSTHGAGTSVEVCLPSRPGQAMEVDAAPVENLVPAVDRTIVSHPSGGPSARPSISKAG
ncbi:sensor histidine kinase [Microvirga pudoricolor]|uniref:sensor histidine kinase n=1 Tax=Microvirga pudoricolor TaxID=2778729 RepID=UPI001950635A|nr:PAS domain-containing sensor histidine kinase [Microvirga pudoricolor]MBM6592409.1 PAS domain-containing sensor histidine kinase [Microvirga pudoricolor]